MADNIVQFHQPTVAENIVQSLVNSDRGDDEELYVLRAYRDKDGVRQLEWFTTECESKVWSVGALHYVAHRLMEWTNEE